MNQIFFGLAQEFAPHAELGNSRQSSVCEYQYEAVISLVQSEFKVDETEAGKIVVKILRRLISDVAVKYLGVDESFCYSKVGEVVVSEYTSHYFSEKLPSTLKEFLDILEQTEHNHYPRKGGHERIGFGLRPYRVVDNALKDYNEGRSYSKRLPYGRLFKYFLHYIPLWSSF